MLEVVCSGLHTRNLACGSRRSAREFPPGNPPQRELHLQVQGLMLLSHSQHGLRSKALLTSQNTQTKSCAVLQRMAHTAMMQTHRGSLKDLYLQDSISRGVMNILPGCDRRRRLKNKYGANLPLQHRLHIKMLKIQTFQAFGKEKHPIPASSTLQVSRYRCRLCFRSLSVFFCRCMELLQAVCKLVTSSSFCL